MLKDLHDRLLELKPEGASHPEDCPFCKPTNLETSEAHNHDNGGSVKTYTEDEVNNLLAQVADLEAKVKELDTVKTESLIEAKVAEVKAELDTQLSELQSKLDTAVLEAEAAKQEKEDILSYLNAVQEEEAAKAEVARIREERIAKVKEVASFPDSHIEANADRWASWSEEVFEASLEDWKAIGAKP